MDLLETLLSLAFIVGIGAATAILWYQDRLRNGIKSFFFTDVVSNRRGERAVGHATAGVAFSGIAVAKFVALSGFVDQFPG